MNLLFSNDRRGEYPPSLYADQVAPLPPFPCSPKPVPLRGDAAGTVQ